MTMQTTNGTSSPTRATGKADLKSFLDSPAVRAKLAEAAGKAMRPEDLIRLALVAASRSPDLAKCSRESILRSLLDAAALGIQPGGLMGRGYLVPRKNRQNGTIECSFDPGWRGLIDIARRSGQIRRIEAHVVYERDEFTVRRTPLTEIEHVPCELDDPGPVRAAYAAAEFVDGSVQIEIVSRRDIDKIRKMGAGGGPWASWFDEMARKTAVRRLCKFLPYDLKLDEAIRVSDQNDAGEVEAVVDAKPAKGKRSLAEKLETHAGAMLPEPQEAVEHDADGVVVERDPVTGEVVPPEREPGID